MAITNYYTDPFHLGNDTFEFENQEALNTNGVSATETREAINTVETNVFSNILDFLSPFTHLNLFGLRNYPSNPSSCIHDLLKQVPIYFVNHDLCGQMTTDGHEIPYDAQPSCTLTWDDLRDIAERHEWPISDENVEKFFQLNEVLAFYEQDLHDHSPHSYHIDDYTEILKRRRIYLWVDHIKDYAAAKGCSYDSILTFTLYHELGHLILDSMKDRMSLLHLPVNPRFSRLRRDNRWTLDEFIREIKEESLAEGLALYTWNNSTGTDIIDTATIYSLVEQKTVPYALGLSYTNKRQLEVAVPIWHSAKKWGRHINQHIAFNWLATIAKGPIISWSQLVPFEYAIYRCF